MAIFKFRKGGDEQPAQPAAPESVEVMRKRARHRLIGASVLVMLGVVGFPLIFDSQPRPIAVDIPIEIPDKGKVRPLGAPALPAATQSSGAIIEEREAPVAAAAASAPKVALAETSTAAVKPEARPESASEAKAPAKPVEKSAEKSPEKPLEKPPAKVPEKPSLEKPAVKPAEKSAEAAKAQAAKAQALLEGKFVDESKAADAARFVVQVGAYNDSPKAQEARAKVEKAGFKTYTQVVGPKDNQRIRVRVGPFATKAEAQKVAEKIKALSLPASILEL
jgi:DedD protein